MGANVFFGDNAQGKTNMLEAVSTALGSSFKNARKSSFIPFFNENGGEKTLINLYYESEAFPDKINEILFESDGERNSVKINSIPLRKAADLYGEFRYVVFVPDHLNLIKGYPDNRRYYLDNIAVMQNKAHKKIQYEYKEALKQRCAACSSRYYFGDTLLVWDDILIKQGINLTYGRLKYLGLLKKYAVSLHEELSNGEKLEISYKSDVFGEGGADFSDKENMYGVYKKALGSAENDGFAKNTPGAHKDDVVFSLNGNSARNFGSQGQLRSVAVSLKLAEAELIRDFNREKPVVLLDEVLGELDKNRREYVIKRFAGDKPSGNSQVFITSCNINDFSNVGELKVWKVEDGRFEPQ